MPSELKIKKGDSVIWINFDSEAHWPASNLHPTHGMYPASGGCVGSKFDACKSLMSGESFEFIFNDVGSWGYHDHLNTAFTGTVIVEE